MNPQEGVFGRIGQSYDILKNNFVELSLPIFIYNFLSVVVFGSIFQYFFFGNLGSTDFSGLDFFTFLNSPLVMMGIGIGIILFIVYLMLYIPVLLGLIKSIKQASNGDIITTKENLLYGMSNLTNSFKTYWYIFSYVALIPAFIFIVGGLLFNAGFYLDGQEILKQIGGFFIILGLLLFIFFAIYRGIKASFPIYSAVDKDSFTKPNFMDSLNITNNNWFRIIGNFLLIGIVISLFVSIISGITSIFTLSSFNAESIESIKSVEDFLALIGDFSLASSLISGTLNSIINTVTGVFLIIFTYMLFLRLDLEGDDINSIEIENKNIEL